MRQHQGDGVHDAEIGMATDERIGQSVQPAEQYLELTGKVGKPGVLFDQEGSSVDIGNGQRMGHRLVEQLVLLVPATSTVVEFRYRYRLELLQAGSQHLGKMAFQICL